MNEIDYGALYGMEQGVNEAEAAEPSDAENAQGENEREPADPVEEAEAVGQDNAEEDAPEVQPPDERARFAAARRRAEAERDAAILRARQEAEENARRYIDEAFAQIGMTNPYTGRPIASRAEFEQYRDRFEAEKKAGILQKSGMTGPEFDAFVAGLPEVRQANEARRQAEEAMRQAREQQARTKVDEQLREIGALDPSVRELSDLAKMPGYPQFYELVKKGYTLLDAFKLVNFDALRRDTAEAGRQAARNAARSKEHLSQTATRGRGAAAVPADVREAYRAFNPDATEAEIQKHYQRYIKP